MYMYNYYTICVGWGGVFLLNDNKLHFYLGSLCHGRGPFYGWLFLFALGELSSLSTGLGSSFISQDIAASLWQSNQSLCVCVHMCVCVCVNRASSR